MQLVTEQRPEDQKTTGVKRRANGIERHEWTHHAHGPKSSRHQQPGNGREWQANLFQENDGEQHWSPVAHQEMRCFAHRLLRRLPELTTVLSAGSARRISSRACPSGSRSITLSRESEKAPRKRTRGWETKRAPRA